MQPLSIEEIRAVQLDLMDHIDAFCRENGIRYSLSGGSLLGAVRHKGFIPWDDDMDILMPRPDYDRFIRSFNGNFPHLEAAHYGIDPDFPVTFTKVMDNRTLFIQSNNRLNRFGIFVDVFAVDGQPSDPAVFEDYLAQYRKLSRDLHKRAPLHRYTDSPLVALKVLARRGFYPDSRITAEKLDALFYAWPFETSEYAGAIMGGSGAGTHVPKEVFLSYMDMAFEDRTYRGLARYDTYLTKMYGDYMTPPPQRERQAPHILKAVMK